MFLLKPNININEYAKKIIRKFSNVESTLKVFYRYKFYLSSEKSRLQYTKVLSLLLDEYHDELQSTVHLMFCKDLMESCRKNHCLFRSLKRTNTALQTVNSYENVYLFISMQAFSLCYFTILPKYLPVDWQYILTAKHTNKLKGITVIFIGRSHDMFTPV